MNYKRINKTKARKYYNWGYDILLLPCRVSDSVVTNPPKYGFIQPVTINSKSLVEFDKVVNEFEYYNCIPELGTYSHYFVSEEDIQKHEKESVKNDSIKEESN